MTTLDRKNVKMLPFRGKDKARIHDLFRTLNKGEHPHEYIADTLRSLIKNHSPEDLFYSHKQSGAYLEIGDLYRYWKIPEPYLNALLEPFRPRKVCLLHADDPDYDVFRFLFKAMSYFRETGKTANFIWVPSIRTKDCIDIFTYVQKKFNFQDDAKVKEGFLNHRYWDSHPEALHAILNDPQTNIKTRDKIRERIYGPATTFALPAPANREEMTQERLEAIIAVCQKEGSLTPLRAEFQAIESDGNKMVGAILNDVNRAFGDLSKTFWELREFVNAAKPGSYAYPLPKPAEKPTGLFARLRDAWYSQTARPSDIPPVRDVGIQYDRTIKKSRDNIELMDKAIDSLYALNRRGGEQAQIMEQREALLRDYVETHGGRLAATDPIMTDIITAAVNNLHRSARSVRFVEGFTVGLAQRILRVREAMAAAATGSTVVATLQTAQAVTENEQWTGNFHSALEHMASAGIFITQELRMNTEILSDVGDIKAAELARSARDIHETFAGYAAGLKNTGNPGIAIGKLSERSPSPL